MSLVRLEPEEHAGFRRHRLGAPAAIVTLPASTTIHARSPGGRGADRDGGGSVHRVRRRVAVQHNRVAGSVRCLDLEQVPVTHCRLIVTRRSRWVIYLPAFEPGRPGPATRSDERADQHDDDDRRRRDGRRRVVRLGRRARRCRTEPVRGVGGHILGRKTQAGPGGVLAGTDRRVGGPSTRCRSSSPRGPCTGRSSGLDPDRGGRRRGCRALQARAGGRPLPDRRGELARELLGQGVVDEVRFGCTRPCGEGRARSAARPSAWRPRPRPVRPRRDAAAALPPDRDAWTGPDYTRAGAAGRRPLRAGPVPDELRYVVRASGTAGEAVVADLGADAAGLRLEVARSGARCVAILITHGHYTISAGSRTSPRERARPSTWPPPSRTPPRAS